MDLDKSQSQKEVAAPQEDAKPEDDVASQGSDFEFDNSDLSDAPPDEELTTELAELVAPPSKRMKRIPPRLALSVNDRQSGSDRGTPGDNRSSVDEEPTAEGPPAKKPRGRPRKSKLSQNEQDRQSALTAGSTASSAAIDLTRAKLQLAKTQIIRLRYAAADCNVQDYAQRVKAILSPQLEPHVRWDVYASLATEVDDVLKTRSLQPVFMRTDVTHAVLPLFQLETEDNPSFNRVNGKNSASVTGVTPRQPGTSKHNTAHSSAMSASSMASARFEQSQRSGRNQTGIESKKGPPSSRVAVQWNMNKAGTNPQRALSSAQEASRPVAEASKRGSAAATTSPAAVCFFCSVSAEELW